MKPQSRIPILLLIGIALSLLNSKFAAAQALPSMSVDPAVPRYVPISVCSAASPCLGDITYYEAGLGTCGVTNNGTFDRIVAMPHVMMGYLSNTNPYCGMTVTIQCISTGRQTIATVQDKCSGCEDYAIDLSNRAFLDLADLAVGRTQAKWWFN